MPAGDGEHALVGVCRSFQQATTVSGSAKHSSSLKYTFLGGWAKTPLWFLQQDRGLVPVGFLRDGEDLEEPLQALAQAFDVIEDLGVDEAAECEHRKVGGCKRRIVLVVAEDIRKRDLA